MSAYKVLQCSLVDKSTLLLALGELGFTPAEYEEPVALRGYADDQRAQKAHIVVKKEDLNNSFTGASNDLGFLWNEESKEYTMVVSDYDVSRKIPQRVIQAYAKVAIETALTSARWQIKERTDKSALRQKNRQSKIKVIARKII